MRNLLKLFLSIFISFFIALGINSLLPEYKPVNIEPVQIHVAQLITDNNINEHSVASANADATSVLFSQNKRKIQFSINSFLKSNFNCGILEKYLFLQNKSISFHNISYCLKNEILVRAP